MKKSVPVKAWGHRHKKSGELGSEAFFSKKDAMDYQIETTEYKIVPVEIREITPKKRKKK